MKKITTLIIGALLIGSPILNAQLSTRTGEAGNYPLGTRPVKGSKILTVNFDIPINEEEQETDYNYGVEKFGIGFETSSDDIYKKLGITTGRLFKMKFFLQDNLALRCAINLTRHSAISKGEIDTSIYTSDGANVISNDYRVIDKSFLLAPGLEYHFAYTNLFDVYAGSDLILGRGVNRHRDVEEFAGDAYDRYYEKTPYSAVGLNPFVGVNMFIANLPLSIGIEYGLSAVWKLGGKTKITRETKTAGGTETSNTFYVQDKDPFGDSDHFSYSKLAKREALISTMNNFRLTLNVYFD